MLPVRRLFLTSASADQYPDAIFTAGSGWTNPPSMNWCTGAFLTSPSADQHPYVFPTAWPRRTRVMAFSQLRNRRASVADANERAAAGGPPWRTPTNAPQPPGAAVRHCVG
ncbi:hypothetical protein Y032_0385g427 [Ancylostoma ceylanicum]|uniref:Uncharacterized protein n=1 Tax=Ancylostoma ceylanicum TaxID=53326 RepID=A0A016RTT4_9BILA|nr:hypothetical protein Y032_0385g427 [Ancylostoma ceylanicum]